MTSSRNHAGALALATAVLLAGAAQAAITLTGTGAHQNNFDTLASTGQNNTGGLAGWEFLELGTSANNGYFATNGAENSGNTFSLGQVGSGERALGALAHNNTGTLQSLFGVQLVNNTGKTITGFTVTYVGEQWRLGQTGRGADRLDFAYRVATTEQSLNAGSFVDVNALDFIAPNTTGAWGTARDGNAAQNRATVSGAVIGLNVAQGEVLTLRWIDLDIKLANGGQAADDALGIDDFVFTPTLAAVPEPATWAMMIGGLGLVGGALRGRTLRPAA